jgi:hypothetical protein
MDGIAQLPRWRASIRLWGVVRAKFQILGAAIEPFRSTRKNAGKLMAAKSGSDVLAK